MARTDTTEGQALWQPGGAEDSRFREGDRHLRLAYDKGAHVAPSCHTISSLQRRFGFPTDLTLFTCYSIVIGSGD